jgi:methionine-S-sulfoxide reductase
MELRIWQVWVLLALMFTLFGCAQGAVPNVPETATNAVQATVDSEPKAGVLEERDRGESGSERATFAGGCFWCVQPPFDELPGVLETRVGYTGGAEVNPTYRQVASGQTGHTEAIEILFDPDRVSYKMLLDVLWRNIDPTDSSGQFVDRGRQYRPGIFYHSEEQRDASNASKLSLGKTGRFDKPIAVEITKSAAFYPAETYHQSYYKKEPSRYYRYRRGSGRDQFIAKHWKDER